MMSFTKNSRLDISYEKYKQYKQYDDACQLIVKQLAINHEGQLVDGYNNAIQDSTYKCSQDSNGNIFILHNKKDNFSEFCNDYNTNAPELIIKNNEIIRNSLPNFTNFKIKSNSPKKMLDCVSDLYNYLKIRPSETGFFHSAQDYIDRLTNFQNILNFLNDGQYQEAIVYIQQNKNHFNSGIFSNRYCALLDSFEKTIQTYHGDFPSCLNVDVNVNEKTLENAVKDIISHFKGLIDDMMLPYQVPHPIRLIVNSDMTK